MLRKLNIDETVATAITKRTMEYLLEREKREPGSVDWVIVHFRWPDNSGQLDFLQNGERNQGNRETRHGIARANADHIQARVRDFLWNRPQARDCFKDCRLFTFGPERHIRLFPVLNALAGSPSSALVEQLW